MSKVKYHFHSTPLNLRLPKENKNKKRATPTPEMEYKEHFRDINSQVSGELQNSQPELLRTEILRLSLSKQSIKSGTEKEHANLQGISYLKLQFYHYSVVIVIVLNSTQGILKAFG